jgi:hypothetical protein
VLLTLLTSLVCWAAALVWPLPAPDRLQVLAVRAPDVEHLGCTSGGAGGRCSVKVTRDGQSRELVYSVTYENWEGDEAVAAAVRAGEPVELLVLPPGTRRPLGAPDVWEVRQAGRPLLRYDQAVAETRNHQGELALQGVLCLTLLVGGVFAWLRRLNQED